MSWVDGRPLVTKGTTGILPHQNWRGQFSSGTYANGARSDCLNGATTSCHPVPWPGWRTTAWHEASEEQDIRTWWGGLVDGMRDQSGQMYMRNRYYDPATGQFTQPDPIGIAGGLNSYGFAAGDPVTYSDPYGLCAAAQVDHNTGLCPGGLTHGEYYALEDDQQQPGGPRGGRGGGRFGGRRPSIPGGSLRANEGAGHTIRDHVNRTRDQIIARARRDGAARSRFTSLAEAETMVNAAIVQNQLRIENWLAPGNYTLDLTLRYTPGRPFGEVAYPNGNVTAGSTVRVVLRRVQYNLDFFVYTAMVEP